MTNKIGEPHYEAINKRSVRSGGLPFARLLPGVPVTYSTPLPDTLDLAAIRARNTLLLLGRLWQGDRARVDLARELGLSRSAISSIVTELMDAGLIHEAGQRAAGQGTAGRASGGGGTVGRRATLLALNARAAHLLAVDLGASHARVDLMDLRCVTRATRTVPHEIPRGPAATYALLADLTQAVLTEAGVSRAQVAGVGAGVPGPVDHATGRVVQPPNMPGWDGENVMAGLEKALGLPTRVDNDANLGALAETRFGAHRGALDLIYVKAATGIGAGVLLGGRLHRGVRGGAGEIGHISINEQGPVGRSGNPGSLESYAAAQVLVETAAARRAAGIPTALPDSLTLADLIAQANTDPLARAVWAEAGHHLGLAISTALNLFNPSAVVIGGRLAQAGEVFLHAVRESALSRTMRINADRALIDLSTLGADAAVLGAGAMLLDHLFTPTGLRHLYRVAAGRGPPHVPPPASPAAPAFPFSLGGTS
ncbi:ROK family transcriptional regulator [Deinococcus metallilatus]|uniref:NBD/HSP70 family sugar kinase n=1 Tax=Deinococcus metallilatus TaxID=1211322 RepID=A0ABR6MUB5_9DEIO|nr:putative NBD/HSP70 family sugar kinase [Deinococcus metallilatus]GMA15044.1 transcriptional regulator [Deinococcus metallilatus]